MLEIICNYIQSWAQILPVLLLPSIGGLLSERSGVANLCLEGQILFGAFGAVIGVTQTGSVWGGVMFAIFLGLLTANLHAFFCLILKINQFVSGIIINQFAFGFTGSLIAFFNNQRPFAEKTIPSISVSDMNISPIFILSFVILMATIYFLNFTYIKSWITACGESSKLAKRSGIPLNKVRYFAVSLSGILCGLAGAHLSIGIMNQFSKGISAGYGFLAIGAIILGAWKPLPTFIACCALAAAEIMQTELQVFPNVPYQIGYLVSYALIFCVMIVRKGKMLPPGELGK